MISLTLVCWASAGADGKASPASPIAAAPRVTKSFDILDGLSSFKRMSRLPGFSNAPREGDCKPASGANRRCQQWIADCFGRAMFPRRIAMLELFGTESLDVGSKFRVAVAQLGQLAAIVSVDLGFDGVGASHGSFFRH